MTEGGIIRDRGGKKGNGCKRTFRIKLLMQIRMVLLQPLPAFLRRATEFAVLRGAMRISLCVLARALHR